MILHICFRDNDEEQYLCANSSVRQVGDFIVFSGIDGEFGFQSKSVAWFVFRDKNGASVPPSTASDKGSLAFC